MSRYYAPSSEDHRPLTYLNGYGIYAAHLVVIVYCVSMVATAILGPAHSLLAWLTYSNSLVLQGQVWRLFTFGLVNPPSIQFGLDMVMIVWFGREVEKRLGWKKFLLLFGGSYVLPPVLLLGVAPWWQFAMAGEIGALAIFVGFAVLYPGAPVFFNLTAQWAAAILVGLFSLMALANRHWAWLLAIWIANAYAYGYARYELGHFEVPDLRFWRRRPKLRVLPDLPPEERAARSPAKTATPATPADVDAILDKIAQSGFDSLTPTEKARLEAARSDLLQRKGR
jgi:hypothetical protein